MSVDAETRRLIYIHEMITLIQDRASVGRESLFSNLEERDATFWRLFTLADAAHHLSDELKARHPEIPWNQVRGFRNVAAHGYLTLALDVAWEIIEMSLPTLKTAVEKELRDRDQDIR